jgi:hypothetical protein
VTDDRDTTGLPGTDGASAPDWWEDHDLAAAVAEIDEFVATAGWDVAPQVFALVPTDDLLRAEPALAGQVTGVYTPIAQDALPAGELDEALAQVSWPEAVVGCVLVQEILVLPPEAGRELSDDPATAAGQAAEHPDRTEARLIAGVLRGSRGGACLLRVRGQESEPPLRGADLAPNLLTALRATFDE